MATKRTHSEIEHQEEARSKVSESAESPSSFLDGAYSVLTLFQFHSTKNQSVAGNKYVGGVAKRNKSVFVRKRLFRPASDFPKSRDFNKPQLRMPS